MHQDTWRRAARSALWPVGFAAAAGLLGLGMTDDRAAGARLDVALAALLGVTFTSSGLIAARRRPHNRLGPLMVALGLLWSVGQLASFSHSPLLFTVGLVANDAWVLPFAYLLASFPSGRL